MKKLQHTLIGAAIALTSFQAAALPFAGVDARSLAMGGTGVAAGSVANASTFNPALLAASREDEDFNLSLAFGISARDEFEMIDALDNLQGTLITDFTNSIDAFTAAPGAGTAGQVQTAGNALTAGITNLSNKPIDLGANLGFNLTIPGETLGMSVFVNARGLASGAVNIDAADTTAINNVITDALALNPVTDPFATTMASTLDLTGAAVTEAGVAFGTKIFGLALGITPKQVSVDAISSSQSLKTADTSVPSDTTESFTDANFDAGVAIDFGLFKIGGVVKNMIEQEYTLINGNKIILEPQARAGIAFDYGWVTLTMDQDLTVNKGVITTGVAAVDELKESQYTAVGVEFDLALVQVRAGMRSDNTGNTDDVLTAGIGIHALASVDLAVAGNDKGVEAVLQVGLRW